MKSNYEAIFTCFMFLFGTAFLGYLAQIFLITITWVGGVIPSITIVVIISLFGIFLSKKLASMFPSIWFLWGLVYSFPLVLYGMFAMFAQEDLSTLKSLIFWRITGTVIILTALFGSYWGKRVSAERSSDITSSEKSPI